MQTPHLLMCAPKYFGVHYVINPWMEGHVNETFNGLATKQWNDLVTLVERNAMVSRLPSEPGLPDLVFTANAAVVRGETAVLSSFLHPERQGEEPHFRHWLETHGFKVHSLPRDVSFEGAGDALFDGTERLWFGHGVRSNLTAAPYLRRILEVEVQPLALLQTRFYHLDTCFCPLQGGYLLYYPKAFDAESNAVIEKLVEQEFRLAVSDEDALHFACNAINIGQAVILHQMSEKGKSWLQERNFEIFETPTTEFLKAGGSTKCLSLRLNG